MAPIEAGLGQAKQILSGAYLNPSSNPYLQATYNEAAQPLVTQFRDATEPGIQAEFAQAGSFGGSAQRDAENIAQQNLAQGLSNLGTNIYGENYEQGMQNMIREQGLLPGSAARRLYASPGIAGHWRSAAAIRAAANQYQAAKSAERVQLAVPNPGATGSRVTHRGWRRVLVAAERTQS